jgi:hypothetical protein
MYTEHSNHAGTYPTVNIKLAVFFSHVPTTLGKVRCYQCGEEFDTKNSMMIHRKIHGEVKECRRLINNQCNRGDNC